MQTLWDDGERVLCRRSRPHLGGSILIARTSAEHPLPESLNRLNHEFGFKDELSSEWAARPLELSREDGRTVLLLEDPGGEILAGLLVAPMETARFLRWAIRIVVALRKLHQSGLIHKDIKPAHILVNCLDGQVRFTGFGLASRLLRQRKVLEPVETIAGTLAYMAPEQTGRMNRSIDSRSDLYSLGVTLYQMLTGSLPFTASDPMEWVHSHIARNPAAPRLRIGTVPEMLSRIVMKLLAKTAEDRYQTAAGLEQDLRRCQDEWQQQQSIHEFTLDEYGASDQLLIPEKLYGREDDVGSLRVAFERLVRSSVPELLLVSGYSGMGKSSVVYELQKSLIPNYGLFAAGKFDQYKRDIPYSTIAQAFQSLIRTLLGKSDAELKIWRDSLLNAIGDNAGLITDLIPELKLIIGVPPAIPELEPQQAQRRFLFVFRRFIGVFARPEHPLVLFLDDLQWLDAATLNLIEDLLTNPDIRNLMLIGAYRNNEVDVTHSLTSKLEAIRSTGVRIDEIVLAPLTRSHVEQLLMESLRSDLKSIEPLAELVLTKTAGNPYFVIRFLHALVDESLLVFDHDARRWCWDTNRIHAKGYTDNIVDLMIGKLTRLPGGTQQALHQLACLGSVAEVAVLSTVLDQPPTNVHAALREAVKQELIERRGDLYAFSHDRVHEAAYLLTSESVRVQTHLRIGRLLAVQIPAENREEAIFEIASQFNRGAILITERDEREQLAQFNLLAGQRAKESTAYASALNYFSIGIRFLDEDCWEHQHELAFALESGRALCEFLTGHISVAEERLKRLSAHARTMCERTLIACLQVDVYLVLNQSHSAVAVCLEFLRHLGIDWSPHPTSDQVSREYNQIWSTLGERSIEALIEMPPMTDAKALSTIEALTTLFSPALHTDPNLACLTICTAINLSLEYGNGDASCVAYANIPRIAGRLFNHYQDGFRFGELGCQLVERRNLERYKARTYLSYALFVERWAQPVRSCGLQMQQAFEAATRSGDVAFGAFTCNSLVSNLLFIGESLVEVQSEAERGLAHARKVNFGLVIDFIENQLAFIRMLRGVTPTFGYLEDARFGESRTESCLDKSSQLYSCWYWIRKLQARFFDGKYAEALEAASHAQKLIWTSHSFLEEAECYFYEALARAAVCDTASPAERSRHLKIISELHEELRVWENLCAENFASYSALIRAEIARIKGRRMNAEHLYEQAIESAQNSGFVHIEALANELASRHYEARGLTKIARLYMQDARFGYRRWGADGKARQLEKKYPFLRVEDPTTSPTTTTATHVEQLDLATVLKVSKAVSGDIVLEKLIDTVMRTAIEQAGAERGLLILSNDGDYRIVAQAKAGDTSTLLQLRDVPVSASMLPESILFHVLRTGESVVIDDALAEASYAAVTYIRENCIRSILCLPLMNHSKLTGALYLENSLTAQAFSGSRIAVLKLVVSQAAISLENARLYREIAEREAKIRRLVDSNIIGILFWTIAGDIIEANDAFLHMVGYEREDVNCGRVCWKDLTPPEFREVSENSMLDAVQSGRAQSFEKEYVRKDGSRVPVIVGLAMLEASRIEGVAFVMDLTDRKRAEEKVHEGERRYRDVQNELAHANRVATMGQLAASIAHEVSQPIAATLMNGHAALRWLKAQPPEIGEAEQVLARLITDANRAADVLDRIRSHIRKTPPQKSSVDINALIREMVDFTHGEATKGEVTVDIALALELPHVEADRVELQQVLLNLIVNAIEAMRAVTDGVRQLHISTSQDESGGILVQVSDSGPGFSTEQAEQVFTAFFTTKDAGLGMGLSICRSIIEGLGGKLWGKGNRPRGAMIQFTIPNEQQKLQGARN
ncbi:AAA family ATPase [Pseudomonas sp. REP124]|uniref:trifunctional serine/threonine-protein kinase/ATP-binding protein/sensor histidine kinase n=1 Tax=Pseudomonas sp. REP124 TaxID=2875731 RepID=UPI001CCB4EB7|nr:ATP-binding sensor histidine kinase [Pseudomonas sp. REP124]MBZ9783657.1 AAA family ATPase [Pseudomonas sp. REP124]